MSSPKRFTHFEAHDDDKLMMPKSWRCYAIRLTMHEALLTLSCRDCHCVELALIFIKSIHSKCHRRINVSMADFRLFIAPAALIKYIKMLHIPAHVPINRRP